MLFPAHLIDGCSFRAGIEFASIKFSIRQSQPPGRLKEGRVVNPPDLAELQAQPVVHDVVHHPECGRGDAGRKFADLDAVKLILVDHRLHLELQLGGVRARRHRPQHFDFQRAQLSVGDDEEVATTARRVEQAQRAKSVPKLPQISHAAAVPAFLKVLEFSAQIVEEQWLDHLQDVLLGGVVRTLRAPVGQFHDRLEERTKDGW